MKVLKIRTLDKGYADPREVMLHACFQSLVDLIEERMFDRIDWQWNEYHQQNYKEMIELYNWWIVKRPNRKDPLLAEGVKSPDIDFTPAEEKGFFLMNQRWSSPEAQQRWNEVCKASQTFEDCNNEDKEMLHRLVNIREDMWT